MTAALVVDGLIVLAVLAALLSGWRNGALAAVLSAIGVGAGLVVGIAVAPSVLRTVEEPSLRLLLLVGILVLLVGIGQIIGSSLGTSVRDRMKARTTQRIDSLFGAVFQSFIALIVIWMISIPVATNLGGSAGQGLRDSRILSNLNAAAPTRLASLPNGVAAMLNESGLPPLVSPWETSISGKDVEDPAPDVQDPELVRSIRPSIIHVLGDAEECSRRLMGSGFVVDNDYVVTNAHVVAGTQTVRLDTKLGLKDARWSTTTQRSISPSCTRRIWASNPCRGRSSRPRPATMPWSWVSHTPAPLMRKWPACAIALPSPGQISTPKAG